MYIQRKLESTILEYLDKPEILAVVGPRQAGKTTLLKGIQERLKNSVFLSFEDRDDLVLFDEDVKGFAKKYFHFRYIFIDEFQYSKNGGKRLKYLFDTYPGIKIIISGSSAIDLTIHAIKYLVGRVFVFHLYQLDFDEYVSFKDKKVYEVYEKSKKSFDVYRGIFGDITSDSEVEDQLQKFLKEFILWGGYPRVAISSSDEEKKVVLKNIYNTYFLRDIRDVLGLSDDFRLSKLIKFLAIQIGQLVSYGNLGVQADYDYLTLKKYLNVLDKTFICQSVRPYFTNKQKELSKNPKIYFFDTGLRNWALENFSDMDVREDRGFLYENFIFNQLLKRGVSCNYWRTKMKMEVDFIAEVNGQKIPIESKCKLGSKGVSRSLRSFIGGHNPEIAVILNEGKILKERCEETLVFTVPHWIL